MSVKAIPEGFNTITPYLSVGNVAELLSFLQKAFGAEITEKMARPDGTVMHAQVKIGTSMLMMGDPQDSSKAMPAMIYLYVPDTDATYRSALNAGGTSIMEPSNQFYGDRNAAVSDNWGNQWWIATHVEDVSPEEMEKRAQEAMK